MTDLCSCAMTLLGADQARPCWLNCGVCGGAWFSPARSPYKLDAESATRIREFIAAGGLVAGVWNLGQVVFVPPEVVVAPPGKAHLDRCPDCNYAATKGRPCDCEGTCRLCGARWDQWHPEWNAERILARIAADAAHAVAG